MHATQQVHKLKEGLNRDVAGKKLLDDSHFCFDLLKDNEPTHWHGYVILLCKLMFSGIFSSCT
jgi:hypothetical protein